MAAAFGLIRTADRGRNVSLVQIEAKETDYELTSRVASTIDGFIDVAGLEEFTSDRLSIVILDNYKSAIGFPEQINRVTPTVVLAIPLNELQPMINASSIGGHPGLRHAAVDMAARMVIRKLDEWTLGL